MRTFTPTTSVDASRFMRTRAVALLMFVAMCVAFMSIASPAYVAGAAAPVDDYPLELRNAPQDSIIDDWGMPNRQCTSYVAWRLSRDGVRFTSNSVFMDIMDADDAGPIMESIGGRADNIPEVGAIIQWKFNEVIYGPDSEADSKFIGRAGGSAGHLAYIEAINPDGSALVSEYNAREPIGTWSTKSVYLWTGRVLHFTPGEAPAPFPPPGLDATPPSEPPADNNDAIAPPTSPEKPLSENVCKKRRVPGGGRSAAGRITMTDVQMRTNQRVAVAALRRAKALESGKPIVAPTKKGSSKAPARKIRLTRVQLQINHGIGYRALKTAYEAERDLVGYAAKPEYAPFPMKITKEAVRKDQRMAQDALRRILSVAHCSTT